MALKAEEVYAILKKQIQSGGGTPGPAGVGIQKIEKTDTQGLVDTYTITYTDGSTTTFTVTNGADGQDGQNGVDGADGASGIFPQTDHGTADTTYVLPPNEFHTWGEVAELNLIFSEGDSGKANEYIFSFDSGATATVLTLPETVTSDLAVEANRHYEISIVNNYLAWTSWAVD